MSTFIRESGKYKPYELQHRFRKRIFLLFKLIIFMFLLYLLISHMFIFTLEVESRSMEPTVHQGDHLFVTPFLYGPFVPFSNTKRFFTIQVPRRGDLVVYFPSHIREKKVIYKIADPVVRFFTLQRTTSISKMIRDLYPQYLVRRIVGGPGDIIVIRENEIFVKSAGQEQIVIDYNPSAGQEPVYGKRRFTLQEDEYFLLCDSRSVGIDSRHFGPVQEADIIGKVVFVYFPFKRFGKL